MILKNIFRSIPKRIRRRIAEECVRTENYVPTNDSLCFLLDLDPLIYQVTGNKAIEYNGGENVKHRLTSYHNFFVSRIKPKECVIDIGCGKGGVACEIATKSKASVVGIDNNARYINYARQNYQLPNLEYILEDAKRFFPHANVDTVILLNVLEHIDKRISLLRKINKHVRPNQFLIRVPMFNRDWRVLFKKELGLPYYLDDTHHIEHTQESFEREMTAAGLCVTYLKICWGEIWSGLIPDHENKSLNDC